MSEKPDKDFRILREAGCISIEPLSDGRISELSQSLGTNDIQNFAVTEPEEIIQRQKVSEWILQSLEADFDSPIESFIPSMGETSQLPRSLPSLGYEFIEYLKALQEKRTSFWIKVESFLNLVKEFSRKKLPNRISQLANEINLNGEERYKSEKKLSDDLTNELRKVIAMEGILKFDIKGDQWRYSKEKNPIDVAHLSSLEKSGIEGTKEVADVFCFGVKKFDESLDVPIELWDGWNGWIRFFGIGKFAKKIVNDWQKSRYYKTCRINSTPSCIAADIAAYINQLFSKSSYKAEGIETLTLTIAYWWNYHGLEIRIIDWGVSAKEEKSVEPKNISHANFGIAEDSSQTEKFALRISSDLNALKRFQQRLSVYNWIAGIASECIIESPRAFQEFCLPCLDKITKKFSDRMSDVLFWQNKVDAGISDVLFMAEIIKRMRKVTQVCIPKIVESGNIFFAKSMYPFRFHSVKRIYPFGEFSVNGQIVNLTGKNGSGKSTVMLSATDLQVLAQIGLPVPAEMATVSIKDYIFLSFLERDSNESTFRAKLAKDRNIVQRIKELKKTSKILRVLVIIDELGTATTQGGVLPVVEPYIKWFSDQGKGISVLMSTQIPELSQYVGQLNGLNYKIGNDYTFIPGIGDGEPEQVAREMGFFDVLN